MFKVGQKIVCIKVNPTKDLVKGEIYTVTDVRLETGGVKLKEIATSNRNCSGYFSEWRFRPIDNTWVEELLCKLISEVEADV